MSSIIFSGDANKGMKIMEAGQWNNQANQLEARGDFAGAEGLFLRSLARKIEITGEDSIQTALARNSLGELYLKMDEISMCAVGLIVILKRDKKKALTLAQRVCAIIARSKMF